MYAKEPSLFLIGSSLQFLDQFETYLNKYGYEYTPTVTVDKPTHRARHSDLDAL